MGAPSEGQEQTMSYRDAELIRWAEVEEDGPMAMLGRRRVIGSRMMISYIRMESGCVVPAHHHANEQFAMVIEGHVRFGVGEEGSGRHRFLDARAGEMVVLPPDVPHSAEALEDSLLIDVFSPPSEKTGIDLVGRDPVAQ
jgi:quercetin dioxygenase-like cupin family protein